MSACAAVTTVLLHLVLIAPFVLGGSRGPVGSTMELDEGLASQATETVTVVFVQEDTAIDDGGRRALLPLDAKSLRAFEKFMVRLSAELHPPLGLMTREENDHAGARRTATEDRTPISLIYARYVELIQARIERVWRKPHTAIGDGSFQCRVRIHRDSGGNVDAVNFESCNGTEPWQASVTRAIHRASPLPVPPDGIASTDMLALDFKSAETSEEQKMESEAETRAPLVVSTRDQNEVQLQAFAQQLHGATGSASGKTEGPIALILTGTRGGITKGNRLGRPLPTLPGETKHSTRELSSEGTRGGSMEEPQRDSEECCSAPSGQ